jgi:hypothetical protein
LATELTAEGHPGSDWLIRQLLYALGYSLQANRKTKEGTRHPGIWVDTKKKELVGNFKNSGREWRPRGDPQKVRVHDFIDPSKGKAILRWWKEMGAAASICREPTKGSGMSPVAWYQQVEQDRASAVLVHQQELARAAAADVCHHCEVDRRQANVHIRPHRSCSASFNCSQSLRTGKPGPIQS